MRGLFAPWSTVTTLVMRMAFGNPAPARGPAHDPRATRWAASWLRLAGPNGAYPEATGPSASRRSLARPATAHTSAGSGRPKR